MTLSAAWSFGVPPARLLCLAMLPANWRRLDLFFVKDQTEFVAGVAAIELVAIGVSSALMEPAREAAADVLVLVRLRTVRVG